MPAVRDKLLVIAPLAQTFLTVPHPLLCRAGAPVTEAGICRGQLVAVLQHRRPAERVLVRWPFSDTSRARWQITRAEKPEARRSRLGANSQPSAFLLSAAQPGDSRANNVLHTPAFRHAACKQCVMLSFAHPINNGKKRLSDSRCIISLCTQA